MAKKVGLGRGLDALMNSNGEKSTGTKNETATNTSSSRAGASQANIPEGITIDDNCTLFLDPTLLKPNPKQPRTEFDEAALQELAESVKANGILQPIIIEHVKNEGFYIVAGERRTRAAKLAGLTKVPVQLRHYSEQKKLEVALIENIQREDLNPIEEATAYANLMQLADLNQDELAKRVGKKRSTIANSMRLLKLPEDMQKSLVTGTLSAGHARALLSVTNDADRRVLFDKIAANGLSVREAEKLATEYNEGGRAGKNKKQKKKAPKRDADIVSIEQQFIEKLGTKCTINGTLERGKIEIEFFSRADLDRVYNILTGK